ncbi:MAG: sulfatase [Bacteroidota bacterium]|nr:sulfatase [Bacteroidota bacterium]
MKITFTCLATVLIFFFQRAAVHAQTSAANHSDRPNIIYIMADDHTSQAWGIYGGVLKDYVKNKNIKRLAAEGAVLNDAFCSNSICVPSRATVMTGQYSNRNGVYTLGDALSPDSMNIAKVLHQSGYQTALIGKWHLKKEPSGFDHFMVMPGQGVYFDPVFKTEADWQDDGIEAGKKYPGYNTDVVTDYSIDWLKNRDTKKPFFLMVHFKATHEPFEYPDRLKDLYKNTDIPVPVSLYDFGPQTNGRSFNGQKLENLEKRWEAYQKNPTKFWTDYPGMPFSIEGLDSLQARKKIYEKFIKDFLRCGAAIDENLGRLLDYLDKAGLSKNTVVIYTADQGYFLGEHGFFDKRMMYEESSRMPFVIRYPKEIKGGTRINDIVLNEDFSALFADYAGVKKPGFIQGRSFRSNLEGKTPKDWRKEMYYRYWEHSPDRPGHFGIRTGKYKLIFYYGQPLGMKGASKETTTPAWEFYDISVDPKELHNAINDKKYKNIIQKLKVELLKVKAEAGDSDEQYPVMKEIFSKYWD